MFIILVRQKYKGTAKLSMRLDITFTKFLVFVLEIFIPLLVLKSRLLDIIIKFHTYKANITDSGTMLFLLALTEGT